jgi:hypothetical protein
MGRLAVSVDPAISAKWANSTVAVAGHERRNADGNVLCVRIGLEATVRLARGWAGGKEFRDSYCLTARSGCRRAAKAWASNRRLSSSCPLFQHIEIPTDGFESTDERGQVVWLLIRAEVQCAGPEERLINPVCRQTSH